MNRLKIALIILFPILAIVVLGFFFSSAFKQKYNDRAVIEKIRNLNRWETASYSIEKIIDR